MKIKLLNRGVVARKYLIFGFAKCYTTVMKSSNRKRSGHIRTHASKRLLVNLRILVAVCGVLLIVTIYDLLISHALFSQVIIALVIGLTAGTISSRMYKISWNKDEAKVIGRIDIYGAIILVLFILFELNRNHIAHLFAAGEMFGSIGLVLITSTLLGRILGTSRTILRVLSKENII
ncbi:MAG: hypothetical protein JWN26_812 [Candidatus Saccharibacteria bacterium]|nr:hypothetical protein [Candidatus Saccharibacteria bacterium]